MLSQGGSALDPPDQTGPGGEVKEHKLAKALEIAHNDVSAAFIHFLKNRPAKARPFIIAAHSQGSFLATRVIRDCIEGTTAEKQFVAAYLAGGYVPLDLFGTVFKSVHACTGELIS